MSERNPDQPSHAEDVIEAGLSSPPVQIDPATPPTPNSPPQSHRPPGADSSPRQTVAGLSVSGFVQNRLAVIAVLFGVTGFLGLPLLWMNQRFSHAERWFWAIANTLYTCGLIYGAFRICLWSYRQVFP